MPANHPEAAWIAILVFFAPIALGTAAFLFFDRSRLRLERDTLQSRENDLRLAIESIAASRRVALFFLRLDSQGHCSFPQVVGYTERFMGCRADDIMADAENWLRCLPDADRAAVQQLIARCGAELQPIRADLQVRHPDGQGRIRIGTGKPARKPDGSIQWTGYWADTTAEYEQARVLAQAKHDAEASAAAKARFLATMSHEIRTPLATVIGALDLIRHTESVSERQRYYELADNAARLLMEIIGDILDFSRLESRHVQPESVPFDLRDVLGQVLRVFRLQVRRKGLALTLDMDPDTDWQRVGDPTRIQQIALNLVGNAVKFTERGQIRVSVRAESAPGAHLQDIVMTVADTGIGIAAAAQAGLFLPFAQADVSITRRYGGSGLGLAVCHRLARLLGGSIRLVESAPGRGSTFELRLPLAQADPAAAAAMAVAPAAAAPAAVQQPRAAGARVLVVEDQEPYRIILRQLLARAGFDCDVAATAEQALDAMARRSYAMLFTDCQLPGIDGFELARQVRRQELQAWRGRMPIVGVTADGSAQQLQRCRDSGMDEMLAKPVAFADLEKCINQWMN